jgi:hypothetical protein
VSPYQCYRTGSIVPNHTKVCHSGHKAAFHADQPMICASAIATSVALRSLISASLSLPDHPRPLQVSSSYRANSLLRAHRKITVDLT